MTHTYRDPDVLRRRFFGPLLGGVLVLVFLFGPPFAFGRVWFSWPVAGLVGVFVFVAAYLVYRRDHYGSCGEIRLGDDGTCELETKRTVIRLHVNEIRSVRYWSESDERSESYTIHYRSGKLHVAKRMTGFADFLTRLKALNPAVDLTSFPADTWPGLGPPATEKRGIVRRFIGSVLFPLIVITLLVYTASQTLVDK